MAEISIFYEGPIVTRVTARAQGLRRFFTGLPCKYGHLDQRKTSSGECVQCGLITDRRYRNTHLEERAAYNLRYKDEKSDNISQSHRRYRIAHASEIAAYLYEYRKTEEGRLRRRLSKVKRRAAELGSPGQFTAADLRNLRERQKKCICGARFTKTNPSTTDHIVSLSQGGSHSKGNIQLLCRPCNARKSAKDPIEFAHEDGRLL